MNPILLIAESDVELCGLYRKYLGGLGYEVETAADGLDCMEKVDRLRPDVLLLDLELRWGGGDGVLAWLREEAVSGVTVVLTATAGSPADFAAHIKPPVIEFLPKPFSLAALQKTVHSAVGNNRHEEPFTPIQGAACPEHFIG